MSIQKEIFTLENNYRGGIDSLQIFSVKFNGKDSVIYVEKSGWSRGRLVHYCSSTGKKFTYNFPDKFAPEIFDVDWQRGIVYIVGDFDYNKPANLLAINLVGEIVIEPVKVSDEMPKNIELSLTCDKLVIHNDLDSMKIAHLKH